MMKTDVNIEEMFPSCLQVTAMKTENERNVNNPNPKQPKQRCTQSSDKTQLVRKNAYRNSHSYVSKTTGSKLSTNSLLYVKSVNRYSKRRAMTSIGVTRPRDVKPRDDQYLSKTTEVCKISYPCNSGCAMCTFSNCFGPVRIYISQYNEPKQCVVREIKDGQGRATIPKSRRKEFRGLIYDKHTHSLYPPIPKGYTSTHLQHGYRKKIFY